jgi:hypothetical protein
MALLAILGAAALLAINFIEPDTLLRRPAYDEDYAVNAGR